MKKSLKYKIIEDRIYQTTEGLMEVRIQILLWGKC